MARRHSELSTASPLRTLGRHLGILGIIVSCIALALTWPFADVATRWWTLVPVVGLALSGAVSWRCWRVDDIGDRRLDGLSPDLPRSFDVGSLGLMISAALLSEPRLYTPRLVHEVSPREGFLADTVTREIELPTLRSLESLSRDEPGLVEPMLRIYVPVLHLKRGALVDELTVTADVGRARVVPSTNGRLLTYQLLFFLTAALYDGEPAHQRMALRGALRALRSVVVADARYEISDDDGHAYILALIALSELIPPGASDDWKKKHEQVLRLWDAAYESYTVFASLHASPGTTVTIVTTYNRVTTRDELKRSESSSVFSVVEKTRGTYIKELVRFICGMRPYIARFPLQYEDATRSYHLRFTGPADQYVASAEVARVGGGDPSHSIVAPAPSGNRLPYIQLHVHRLPGVEAEPQGGLQVRLAMRERPPGLLGLVALLNVIQLLLVICVLGYYRHLFTNSASDFTPLVLAVPGFIAAWLAAQISPSRLERMALSAFGGIAFSGVSAIGGTILAVLATDGVDPLRSHWRNHPVHTLWLCLLIASAWVAANMVLRWLQMTYIYLLRCRETPELERYTA